MKEISLKELRKEIEKSQDEKRFEHTLGVTYTAAVLAMCHDENIEKAKIAGLLHDCAKCISDEKKIKLIWKLQRWSFEIHFFFMQRLVSVLHVTSLVCRMRIS